MATLSSVVTDISTVTTNIFEFGGEFLEELTSNPLTMTILAVSLVGAGLSFVLRLIKSA